MNDQCHDCKIRKLCYLEEPEEDWTCDHYEPCEYDEEVATDINVGDKDTISRKAAIEALKNDMASLDHIIKGMSANDVRLDAYVSQRNQVNYDIYTINNLPPAEPQIIRCKDCKYWIPYNWMFSEVWQSKNIADYPEDEIGCNLCDMAMKANDFCSRAERRTDEA